jgi:glycine dehydrogenase subunit 1
VYEGPSAVAAAAWLAHAHTKKTRFLVSEGLHPHSRETLATTSAGWGTTIETLPLDNGLTQLDEVGDDVAAIILAQPNFYGAIEDLEALSANKNGALLIVQADPLTLGVLRPPGDFDVDICVGEGQTLGNRLDYGGPSFGFFAAQEAYLRRMPGRIAGETKDVDGRRGFVLTLQTREQHIRREKATHNICTAQALNALAGMIYLSWLGRQGIVELGELLVSRTHYARETLSEIDGVELWHDQPVVREFALRIPDVHAVVERCAAQGVNPGHPVGDDVLLVAITEQRSKADIDRLADVLKEALS